MEILMEVEVTSSPQVGEVTRSFVAQVGVATRLFVAQVGVGEC